MENNNLEQLAGTAKAVIQKGNEISELDQLKTVDVEALQSFIKGFDHLFTIYTNESLSGLEF